MLFVDIYEILPPKLPAPQAENRASGPSQTSCNCPFPCSPNDRYNNLMTAIAIPLVKFLTVETCPADWKPFDLYLIRDDQIAFYVGQSQCAFARVWEHLHGGIHGHSIVGRFILVNWPKSAKFTVELLASCSARFAALGYQVDSAERELIEQYAPCFNVSLNRQPTPIPPEYLPPNAPIQRLKSFRRMLREAAVAAARMNSARDTEWG